MADLGEKTKFFRLARANCTGSPSLSLSDHSGNDSDRMSDEESEDTSFDVESCTSSCS